MVQPQQKKGGGGGGCCGACCVRALSLSFFAIAATDISKGLFGGCMLVLLCRRLLGDVHGLLILAWPCSVNSFNGLFLVVILLTLERSLLVVPDATWGVLCLMK